MKIVTIARLKKMGACEAALEKLRTRFRTRIVITPVNLDLIESDNIDIRWFVENLPRKDAMRAAFERALKRKPVAACKRQTGGMTGGMTCVTCARNAAARRVLLRSARG